MLGGEAQSKKALGGLFDKLDSPSRFREGLFVQSMWMIFSMSSEAGTFGLW